MRRFLLILLILALGGGAVWYFVILPKQQPGNTGATNTFKSFLSLGNSTVTPLPSDTNTVSDEIQVGEAPQAANPFSQVSAGPVAGFTAYTNTKIVTIPATNPKLKPTQKTITEHIVRYVSRSNGYVYEVKDDGVPTQVTNIFIPNVYEASFADNNKTAILRFLRDDDRTIATYSVPIPELNADGTRTQLSGTYLPENIQSLVVSPDQKTLALLTTSQTSSLISTSDSRGGVVKAVLQNPFHEWLLSWTNQLYAQTKASSSASGFLYRVDSVNKKLVRVLGNIPGLTTSVSPKGTYILYSQSTPDGFSTKLFTTKTGSVKDISLAILPEKCTWLANEDLICAGNPVVATQAAYPDDWYKGVVLFSDSLYHIYGNGGYTNLKNSNAASYDMTNLTYDESQNRLYFIDKNTGYLWKYSI